MFGMTLTIFANRSRPLYRSMRQVVAETCDVVGISLHHYYLVEAAPAADQSDGEH